MPTPVNRARDNDLTSLRDIEQNELVATPHDEASPVARHHPVPGDLMWGQLDGAQIGGRSLYPSNRRSGTPGFPGSIRRKRDLIRKTVPTTVQSESTPCQRGRAKLG